MMKRSTNAASEKNQRRALPSTNKKNPPIAGRRSPTLQQSPAKSSQSRATSSSSKLSANTGSKSVSKQAPKRNLSPIRQSSPTPPPEAPSLICVLKYSKKQSSRLQTLLKLKPCPIKKDAQARPEKRARPTEDRLTPATPPTKRQKVAEVGASSRAATTKTSVAGKTVHGRPSPPRKANSAPLVAAAVRRTESRNGQTPAAKSDGRIGDIRGDRNEDRSGKKQPPLDPAIQTRLEGFQGENTKYVFIISCLAWSVLTFAQDTSTQENNSSTEQRGRSLVKLLQQTTDIPGFSC